MLKSENKLTIGIVGCSDKANPIIELLCHDRMLNIRFVHDNAPGEPCLMLARTHKITILNDLSDIKSHPVDVILNLTGSIKVGLEIKELISDDVELIGAKSAGLISTIIDERRKRMEERERVSAEREVFHSMGLHMENIDNLKDAGFAIINYASTLCSTKAAAISYYNEEAGEMVLVASNNLPGFEENMRWSVEECAATKKVITNTGVEPESFNAFELEQLPGKHFTELHIQTVIAVPLVLQEKVKSIIYLCDFDERIVLRDDLDSLALLGVYASLILDKVKVHEQMRHLIVTDGLTGLANQRFFMEQIEKEFQRSTRYGHDLSIVIFDIDNFKPYITEYGHLQGNEILKRLSGLLTKSVRETDTAARFGVEKFCILLCEIGKDGAFTFAQRLVERVASFPMPNQNITVSAGVASYPGEAKTYMELISRAEGNLHRAKEWGKNRACS